MENTIKIVDNMNMHAQLGNIQLRYLQCKVSFLVDYFLFAFKKIMYETRQDLEVMFNSGCYLLEYVVRAYR